MKSAGPPRTDTILANVSAASPEAKLASTIWHAVSKLGASAPRTRSSAASATVTSWRRGSRWRPVRKSTALITSTALPAAEARGSFLSVNDPRHHFGLAEADSVERLSVVWPDGFRRRYLDLPADRLVNLER